VIAIIKGDEVIDGRPTGPPSKELFDRAAAREGKIIISALVLVEAYKPHPRTNLTAPSNRDLIHEFFKQPFIEIVEVGRRTAQLAREIALGHNVPSWDAIHVASAIHGKAEILFSWDTDDLVSRKQIQSLNIMRPTSQPRRIEPQSHQADLFGSLSRIGEEELGLES
jgi:predicted nucleic acid-binding protein